MENRRGLGVSKDVQERIAAFYSEKRTTELRKLELQSLEDTYLKRIVKK